MSGTLPTAADPAPLPPSAVEVPALYPVPAPPRVLDEAPAGPPPTGTLGRYLSALARHRWVILAATALGTAAGIAGSRMVRLQYQAQANLWIEPADKKAESQGPIRTSELLQSYAWVDLLKSYTVLDPVVREQRLYVQPDDPADRRAFAAFDLAERFRPGKYRLEVSDDGKRFALLDGDGAELQRGSVGAPVGEAVGFRWAPGAGTLHPGGRVGFTVQNPRDVARELKDQLEAEMAEEGPILRLTLTGHDAEQAAATLNTLARRYVSVAAQLKRAKLDELTRILEEQRQYAEQSLHDAEISLEGFRVRTVTLPSEEATPVAPGIQMTRDPVFNDYFEMKVSRENLHRDREAVQRVLGQALGGQLSFDALSVIPAVQASPELMQALNERTTKRAELRTLQQKYTDEHPPVKRLVEDIRTLEQTTIPGIARTLVNQLDSQEREMDGRIDAASGELRQIPSRAIEEARLQRRVTIAANLYATLRQRYEEARLAAVSSVPDVRVLDPAQVQSAPVKDLRPVIVAAGALAALALTVLLVLLRDRMDRRVRYPEQVTRMGLPVLGAIPHAHGSVGGRSGDDALQLAEAFRELRLSLMHAHGAAGPLMVTVTSPESGDGKSTIACNLALAFADQGHRTLLIDGDIRRGDLHHLLNTRRSPGLTDYLAGRADLRSIVQTTDMGPINLIGSGTRMQGGPELLGSPAMGQLVQQLRSHFSVIIMDSAPLGAGVDAYVLGTTTGNLVMVLRTGITDGDLAEAKLGLLDRLPVRVLGAVLNDVPPSRAYRYYSYLPGYGADDERNEAPQLQGA